ncbi:MAG: response regulator transcription factor [Deltaproteobacteria bacterium]|nr:response regulator transcription factor [Deltaproteobacteria bacterium]
MAQRILVIDDEPDLLELVRVNLRQAGFEVELAATGSEAIESLRRSPPDLILLDLMLPDLSGTEICRRVRANPDLAHVPIIMLTARASEIDRVVGLELGADDYVTKPFSPRELVLRVRAVLRRSEAQHEPSRVLERGAIRLDPERRRCFANEQEVPLTAKEFDLLQRLMARPGRVMTREHLLEQVWGSDIVVTTRTIDTHLKRLREKLGDTGELIETVRGVGYRFAE